mmetsp:Transcript_39737/g.77657  ORF Transcript_39737/g.77657 Transcript_39737/m.77657 type:complete len:529 (-) Transcript_39737:162-1748(-)
MKRSRSLMSSDAGTAPDVSVARATPFFGPSLFRDLAMRLGVYRGPQIQAQGQEQDIDQNTENPDASASPCTPVSTSGHRRVLSIQTDSGDHDDPLLPPQAATPGLAATASPSRAPPIKRRRLDGAGADDPGAGRCSTCRRRGAPAVPLRPTGVVGSVPHLNAECSEGAPGCRCSLAEEPDSPKAESPESPPRALEGTEGGGGEAPGIGSVPADVLGGHVLTFLTDAAGYAAVSLVSKHFRALAQGDVILGALSIEGERDDDGDTDADATVSPSGSIPRSGGGGSRRGLILPEDTAESASARLDRFVRAGNPSAMYMLGIIRAYCFDDVDNGVAILRRAVGRGHVASSYVLGLILRDCRRAESARMLLRAAREGYLPALQEVLPQREMKARHGEPSAAELERYLDPQCLHSLLLRHYLRSPRLRTVHTSHCWNPKCGRWAYKAVPTQPVVAVVQRVGADPPAVPDALAGAAPEREGGDHPAPAALPSSKKKRVSRMKMCSCCRRAKYCSKLCQVFDWRSGRHKMECQYI